MYELEDIINYDSSMWSSVKQDNEIESLADIYEIRLGDYLKELTDQINFLVDSTEDTRRYRKTLQVFQLCQMRDVRVNGIIGNESKTIQVDDVLFLVFHNLRQDILDSLAFYGYSVEEVMNDLYHLVEKEKEEETYFKRKIITTLVAWLRDKGIFKKDNNTKSIGNREAAFIYDVMEMIGLPFEKYKQIEKGMERARKKGRYHQYNKYKQDRIKSYL